MQTYSLGAEAFRMDQRRSELPPKMIAMYYR